ncbi:hypothetical protein [Shewanella algae]|uniref:hypothetical protein n=1 Tax=Shewanella algae TaxID=38313 RepID=UPI003005F41E
MLKFKSTIFSDENDIYVALQSNKSKLSTNALRKLAFKRGIIYPSFLNRDELIGQISELPFTFSQLQELTNKLTPKINRDQYSVKRIFGKFDLSKLNDVIEKVVENRPRFVGAENISHHQSIQTYIIEVDYTEFDFGRGKYQQKKRHGGYIQFLEKPNYVSIQYTYTKRIDGILNEVIKMYYDTVNKDFSLQSIDLSPIIDASLRNEFIKSIYETSNSFMFLELAKVRVSKIHSILESSKEEIDSSIDDLDSDLIDDDEDKDTSKLLQPNDDREYSIDNAQFDGNLLNDANEVNELCQNNFYRSRIKWKSKALFLKDKPLITFELAFDNKHQAKDLKFRIIGKENIVENGLKEAVIGSEFDIVIRELEDCIFSSYDRVTAKIEQDKMPQPKEASNA